MATLAALRVEPHGNSSGFCQRLNLDELISFHPSPSVSDVFVRVSIANVCSLSVESSTFSEAYSKRVSTGGVIPQIYPVHTISRIRLLCVVFEAITNLFFSLSVGWPCLCHEAGESGGWKKFRESCRRTLGTFSPLDGLNDYMLKSSRDSGGGAERLRVELTERIDVVRNRIDELQAEMLRRFEQVDLRMQLVQNSELTRQIDQLKESLYRAKLQNLLWCISLGSAFFYIVAHALEWL